MWYCCIGMLDGMNIIVANLTKRPFFICGVNLVTANQSE